jgi:hypothetical protein
MENLTAFEYHGQPTTFLGAFSQDQTGEIPCNSPNEVTVKNDWQHGNQLHSGKPCSEKLPVPVELGQAATNGLKEAFFPRIYDLRSMLARKMLRSR